MSTRKKWLFAFECYYQKRPYRKDRKAYKKRKFKDLHQRYKPIAEWLELPFMGRRYR